MAIWRKKESATAAVDLACYVRSVGKGLGRIPKGYVPMVLVGDREGGEERVLVHIETLKEPHVLALLELSAQRFGYGQCGVLRLAAVRADGPRSTGDARSSVHGTLTRGDGVHR
uniref:SAUR protein n=1 Tax=Phyllostachys edulis TaxID=38705 RepID=A0A1D8F0K0_PHYED|nr:SAUR protein [Phyllostachys edulis]